MIAAQVVTTPPSLAPGSSPRDLYLSLLVKTLTNTVYGDPSIHPSQPGGYNAARRAGGEDWPAQAHSMVGLRRMSNLRELTQRALDEGIPGDFIETGVWRGGCCILMRGVLAANGVTDRRVFVADSFAGLPPPMVKEDAGDVFHTYAQLAVSLAEVQANFAKYDLLDDQVEFVPGLFEDTLADLEAGPFALIRLDGDMYSSTMVALEALYPKLSPGGFVVIDDFVLPRCARAVEDYRKREGITARIVPIDKDGVWWQKPRQGVSG